MNEIAVYPHKTCIFALEKSCLPCLSNNSVTIAKINLKSEK